MQLTENVNNYFEQDPNLTMLRPRVLMNKFNVDDLKCFLDWNQTTNRLSLEDHDFLCLEYGLRKWPQNRGSTGPAPPENQEGFLHIIPEAH